MMKLEDDSRRALRSTRTVTSVLCLAVAVATSAWYNKGVVTLWQWYSALLVVFVLMVTALSVKKLPTMVSGMISLFSAAALLIATMISNVQLSEAHVHFEGFQGFKVTAIVFAIVAVRPTWVGLVIIGICGVVPTLMYYTLSQDFRNSMVVQEPWLTLSYAIFGFAFYRYRIKSTETEQKLLRAQAQKESLDRLAKVLLAVRDLSNSPLQTITTTTALLAEKDISREDIARLNTKALKQLNELNQILSSYEKDIDWSKMDSSFDAMGVLKQSKQNK